eukprot:364300-Chlamydomonas_euryale.AAC.9
MRGMLAGARGTLHAEPRARRSGASFPPRLPFLAGPASAVHPQRILQRPHALRVPAARLRVSGRGEECCGTVGDRKEA